MTFNIGRVHGTPTKVTIQTHKGPLTIGRRSEWAIYVKGEELQLIVPGLTIVNPTEMIRVPVQDYMDHFLFEVPETIPGPTYRCTCGSSASLYGSEVYKHGASAVGLKLQCDALMQYGNHANGIT